MEVAYLMVCAASHLPDEEKDDPLEHEDDQEDRYDPGKLVLKKEDDVIVPAMLNELGYADMFFLRGRSQKVHDYRVSLSGKSAIEQYCVSCL